MGNASSHKAFREQRHFGSSRSSDQSDVPLLHRVIRASA